MFRIRDGKIAEEWVCRDELGMLIQLGVVALSKYYGMSALGQKRTSPNVRRMSAFTPKADITSRQLNVR